MWRDLSFGFHSVSSLCQLLQTNDLSLYLPRSRIVLESREAGLMLAQCSSLKNKSSILTALWSRHAFRLRRFNIDHLCEIGQIQVYRLKGLA